MAITLKLSNVDAMIVAKILDAAAKTKVDEPSLLGHLKAKFGDTNLARIAAALETALAADADTGRRRRA